MRILRLLLLASIAASTMHAQERPWSIDPKPALRLGDANNDQAILFGNALVGATRLPNGGVLVADRGALSLKVFDPAGKHVKSLGRKGEGPGEFDHIAEFWRCGEEIVAYDIGNGYRVTVFSTDLALKRSFRFRGPPEGGSSPYSAATACNTAGTFIHHGWEVRKDMKAGVFRANVPLWLSGADSTFRRLGEIPGSERWGQVVDGVLRGTRPMPLGKQPVIAIGVDRIYTGAADTYIIAIRDFSGRPLGTFGKPGAQLATTKADVDFAIDEETAGRGDDVRERVRKAYDAMDLPKTVPAYKAMLVDSEGMVWVQDYPRNRSAMTIWTVFTRDGRQSSEVQLPTHLTVFEIGRDYVLGKFIDPEEDIPEIRVYRLRR